MKLYIALRFIETVPEQIDIVELTLPNYCDKKRLNTRLEEMWDYLEGAGTLEFDCIEDAAVHYLQDIIAEFDGTYVYDSSYKIMHISI